MAQAQTRALVACSAGFSDGLHQGLTSCSTIAAAAACKQVYANMTVSPDILESLGRLTLYCKFTHAPYACPSNTGQPAERCLQPLSLHPTDGRMTAWAVVMAVSHQIMPRSGATQDMRFSLHEDKSVQKQCQDPDWQVHCSAKVMLAIRAVKLDQAAIGIIAQSLAATCSPSWLQLFFTCQLMHRIRAS